MIMHTITHVLEVGAMAASPAGLTVGAIFGHALRHPDGRVNRALLWLFARVLPKQVPAPPPVQMTARPRMRVVSHQCPEQIDQQRRQAQWN